jgi:hypothetical protein
MGDWIEDGREPTAEEATAYIDSHGYGEGDPELMEKAHRAIDGKNTSGFVRGNTPVNRKKPPA